jgi:hypothetical protein
MVRQAVRQAHGPEQRRRVNSKFARLPIDKLRPRARRGELVAGQHTTFKTFEFLKLASNMFWSRAAQALAPRVGIYLACEDLQSARLRFELRPKVAHGRGQPSQIYI